jgi:hypothetical protein
VSRDVCGALTEILRERREWDEEPCLYAMYRQNGRVRLSRLTPAGSWPTGPPAQTLAALAGNVSQVMNAAIVAVPGLSGFAFRTEIWGVRGPAGRAREPAAGPRPSLHPDRVEQRFMWAVTCDGTHYVAMQNRGEHAILARKPDSHDGEIPRALERMARAITAGVN